MRNLEGREPVPELTRKQISEELLSEDIEIPDVSDIIVMADDFGGWHKELSPFYAIKEGGFMNLMTFQTGDTVEEVVREGKNYLMFYLCGMVVPSDLDGIYACRSKKHDALIISQYKLHFEDYKWEWREVPEKRAFVSSKLDLKGRSIPYPKSSVGLIDICGQGCAWNNNRPVLLKKTMFDYFGVLTFRKNTPEVSVLPMASTLQIIQTLNTIINEEDNGTRLYDDVDIYSHVIKKNFPMNSTIDAGTVSSDALKAMKGFMEKIIFPNYSNSFFDYEGRPNMNCNNYCLKSVLVSYIQNVEGQIVERSFLPAIYRNQDRFSVEFYEVQQTLIKSNEIVCYDNIQSYPVYYEEGIENTFIGGAAKWILGTLFECIDNANTITKFYLSREPRVPYAGVVITPVGLAESVGSISTKTADKIFKLKGMTRAAAFALHDELRIMGWKADECVFGQLNTKARKLNRILQIPKGMLEYVIERGYNYKTIGLCKEIFKSTEEGMEYFQNMCEEDYKQLVDYFSTPKEKRKGILAPLAKEFGYKGWKSYIRHEQKLNDTEVPSYLSYIDCISFISKLVDAEFDWKVSGEAFEKAYVTAKCIKEDLLDENREYKIKRFAEKNSEWESLEYENRLFRMLAPKEPADLIREGVCLHHCAGDYTMPVAEGDTTVLFIRKKEDMEKPFFTVEIRGNEIVQCHGFGNRNACTESGITEFLCEYAGNFGFLVGNIDDRIGPPDNENLFL